MKGAITLTIKNKTDTEYRFDFIDPAFADPKLYSKGRVKLASFLRRKASEAKPHSNFTYDYEAFIAAAVMVERVNLPGAYHHVGWWITLDFLTFEELCEVFVTSLTR